MTEATVSASVHTNTQTAQAAAAISASLQSCEECLGSGGWYRYEPALDPAPGLLYLSCMQCRGSGRTILPQA
jgi:DnaJ-class molecular chaperone